MIISILLLFFVLFVSNIFGSIKIYSFDNKPVLQAIAQNKDD